MGVLSSNVTSKHLILGGARSGKSCYAQQLACDSGASVIFVATARVLDDEVSARVKQHQVDRPAEWTTIEEPLCLADTLRCYSKSDTIILVDCLTMWVMNLLAEAEQDSQRLQREMQMLFACIPELPGQVLFVSNETGMGVIPMGELTRQFVDESGRLHQRLAQLVDHVTLMVAGLPHTIK